MATITIATVSPKKSGATNGRKWTLYEVRTADGKTLTTFDAEWTKHVGESVEVAAPDRNRLGTFPKVRAESASNGNSARRAPAAPVPASPDKFVVLSAKLDRLLDEIAAIRRHFA